MYTVVMSFGQVRLVAGTSVYVHATWADKDTYLGPAGCLGTAFGFGASFQLTLVAGGNMGVRDVRCPDRLASIIPPCPSLAGQPS